MSIKTNLPRAIEDYLNRAAIAPVDSLLLSFDENWQWLGYAGDLARFSLEQTPTEEIASLVFKPRLSRLCTRTIPKS